MFPESVILVVGGESDETETITSMLADRFRVVGVENPDDAMTYTSDGVDLVISQLDSPEFSGLQLFRKWRARDTRTPFLFITEGGDISCVVEAMKLGAGHCLAKPIQKGELRAAVDELLERAASDSDHSETNSQGNRKLNIDIPPGTSLEDLERAAVEQALTQHQGNRTHAAKTLGISVRTLQRKLKAWGIPVLPSMQNSTTGNHVLYTQQHSLPMQSTPYSAHAL
jgi:DNA-binding NtrC family response regulator